MTEHKDMTISEIEEVLKEYTCEFVRGRDNYFYVYFNEIAKYVFDSKYDFTQKFYFSSEEKINDFMERVGESNFEKFYKYLNKDLIENDVFNDNYFQNEYNIVRDKTKKYYPSYKWKKRDIYTIRPYKENGKYVIKYIKVDNSKDLLVDDICFETLEDAEKGVNEIGEYNILHYVFLIKDSVLKESNTTPQNDIVKNPSHYQGKNGLEVYEVLENFLEDVESYYVGNVIKYILRYRKKNKLEDLKKAREYLDKLIERENDGE